MSINSRIGKLPLITVAVPTKNNSSTIQMMLKSLKSQDYPKNRIQVVFVDGLSRDGTYKKIASWTRNNKKAYADISIKSEKSNIPTARNICLNMANSKYILFWDADVVSPTSAIRTLLNDFKDPGLGIANHPYYVEKPGLIDKVLRFDEPVRTSYVKAVVMGFTMIRKQLIREVGYFNEALDGFEDQEFCRRVGKTDFKIMVDPSVRLTHLKRGITLTHFAKENFSRRSKYVNTLIRAGVRINIVRALYYVLLPLNFLVGLLVAEFVRWRFGICILEIAVIYTLPSFIWHLRRARRSYYGLLSPLVHLVGGVTLAYGMLWQAAKEK